MAKSDKKKKKKKAKKESGAKNTKKSDNVDKSAKKDKSDKSASKGSSQAPANLTAANKKASQKKTSGKKPKLADMQCIPCRGGVPPLDEKQIKRVLPKLRGWKAIDLHHLEREIKFPDFASALDFTIEVGELAEVEQHHPDIYLSWGKVKIQIWTHKINGLTESDFILAAKIDQLV